MIPRTASLALLALAAALLSNCAGDGTASAPKPAIGDPARNGAALARAGTDGFPVSIATTTVQAATAAKPKDRHKMPVYAFSDRHRYVRATAYTCTEDDHLIYGNKNAAGTYLRYGDRVRSAAADWSFYPVGTTFRVKGLPYLYVVDDYGSALTGTGTIDLYKPNKAVMNQWGLRNIEITIVQWGSFTRSAEILSQRTKFAHCNQMLANIIRQRPDLASVAKR
jgi:3D (Asp-Asp-Asp) domain-containing protein